MADDPDDVVLALLGKLDQRTERMAEDLYELQAQMTAVEEGLMGVNQRIDRLEQRVDRIERKLEQVEVQY